MTRVQILLGALAAILVVVLFWLLLWSPQQDELQTVRDDIDRAQEQQVQLANERDQLRSVRDEAPEIESELAAGQAVVPNDPALPSALRQLQVAADESGATLVAVSPNRPEQVPDADEGVSSIAVGMQVEGGYFQLVDFLRRIEDPAISPRGLIWADATIARTEADAPLTANLAGVMFVHLPSAPEPQPESDPDDADDDPDVTIDVEEND